MKEVWVDLRFDLGGIDYVPHSFLVIKGPDEEVVEYGFVPLIAGSLAGSVHIGMTQGHEYGSTTGRIPISLDSYYRLVEYINNSIKNSPQYYLPFGSQCANCAAKGLVVAGVSVHFYAGSSGCCWTDFLPAAAWETSR